MYTKKNYKTKKDLQEAVQQWTFLLDSLRMLRELDTEWKWSVNGLHVRLLGEDDTDWEPVEMFLRRYKIDNSATRAYIAACPIIRADKWTDIDYTGSACLEGPHAPAPHAWYAECQITRGIVTGVK